MRTLLFAVSIVGAALAAACGGSDTYVQPVTPAQPAVTVVQQPPPAPAPATTVIVDH